MGLIKKLIEKVYCSVYASHLTRYLLCREEAAKMSGHLAGSRQK